MSKIRRLVSLLVVFMLCFIILNYNIPTKAQEGFSDVPPNHWAYEAIMDLVRKGILSGYPDGTFKPENPVKRSETSVILTKVFNLDLLKPERATYIDVPKTHWSYGYVEVIGKTKLMSDSIENGRFRPEENLKRIEFVPISVKALGMKMFADVINEEEKTKTIMVFSDASQVPIWARGYLTIAIKAQIVSGYPDRTFKPRNNITRAEIASLIYNMLKPIEFDEQKKWDTIITPASGAPFRAFLSKKLEGSLLNFIGNAYPNGKVAASLNGIPFKEISTLPDGSYNLNIPLGFVYTGEINFETRYFEKGKTSPEKSFKLYSAIPFDLFPNYYRLYKINYNIFNREITYSSKSTTPIDLEIYNTSTGDRKSLEIKTNIGYEIKNILRSGENNVNIIITGSTNLDSQEPGKTWRLTYGIIITVN